MLRIDQVKMPLGHSQEDLKKKAARLLKTDPSDILEIKILRQSIDARKKPEICYRYGLAVAVRNEDRILQRFRGKGGAVRFEQSEYVFPQRGKNPRKYPPVVVGAGPAGLFCAYFLALYGYRPILLERGRDVDQRRKDVEEFWQTGRLDPGSNVQFGEGGAGAFSDGKLNTLVKDRDGRNGAVLETFVRFGADPGICYEAKPHIGTDVLCGIVKNMRQEILRLGGQVRFESQVTDLEIKGDCVAGIVVNHREQIACSQVVLACGHSARDTFQMLYEKQVPMEAKAFATGLRMEHPQSMINESQYGISRPGALGAAPYKVTAKTKSGRGVYSFCMCPGGYVVNASSEAGRTAVNGMSYSKRDGRNANSAIVVTVTPEDFGDDHPLAGIGFQRRLEERAFSLGEGKIPIQRYGEFKACVLSCGQVQKDRMSKDQGDEDGMCGEVCGPASESRRSVCKSREEDSMREDSEGFGPQCMGDYAWADVSQILPGELNQALLEGIEAFGKQIRGFNCSDAILSGVESRTSSPVRICRDETLQSRIRGLYPCGEGAGYAGGITSAAMDGIRAAEMIASEYAPDDLNVDVSHKNR